jgi:DNA-directed RNA polymerase subunit RPC12/RpoP
MKRFTKNDSGFVCANCGAVVPPLGSTSRDHCNVCLHSLHVDVLPGDRANSCRGMLVPTGVGASRKKGYIIQYKCARCGARVNNKAAQDDNFEEILRICKTAQ